MGILNRLRPPLDDGEIIELYFARDERAIEETDKKYRKYLLSVAYNILYSNEDCEECINDTYIGVWEAIPPERPNYLKAFLTTIVRRVCINRYNEKSRQKRVPTCLTDSLEEMERFMPDNSFLDEMEAEHLGKVISDYLSALTKRQRFIFMSRYYMAEPIDKIASELSVSRSTVNKEIAVIKDSLKLALEREEYKI